MAHYQVDIGAKLFKKFEEHWYKWIDGNYYPGASLILIEYPKGFGFQKWLTEAGDNAEKYKNFTAGRGANIHDGCHVFLKEGTVSAITELSSGEIKENYKFDEWENVNTFKSWWEQSGLTLLYTEQTVVNTVNGYAGTVDIIAIDAKGVIWIIDIKTGGKYPSHSLQISAYGEGYKQMIKQGHLYIPDGVAPNAEVKGAVLYLGTATKKKWSLKEVDSMEHEFGVFKSLMEVWKHKNPGAKPKELQYPLTLTKGIIENK